MTATSTLTLLPRETDDIENEAAICGLLATFFLRNPDQKLLEALSQLDATGFEAFPTLQPTVSHLKDIATAGQHGDEVVLNLKRDWTKLFRGISPDYGPTAPYAFLFLRGDTPNLLSDLAALYLDGGYDGYQEIHDRLDYIGTCFDYLKTVDLQRIHAVAQSDLTNFNRLTLCRNTFMRLYFMPWIAEYIARARKFVQTDFYNEVFNLTLAYLDTLKDMQTAMPSLLSEAESLAIARQEEEATRQMIAAMEAEEKATNHASA